jgi:membrane associated rhomboid family serine protease
MVFPIGDDNSDRRIAPVVNIALIALNVLVFVFLQGCGSNLGFTYAFSTVPGEIVSGTDAVTEDRLVQDPSTGEVFTVPGLQPTPFSVYITLLTSMFMHGSFAHILGNMFFLMIFGDNIENRLGHGRYVIFYLVTGLLASLAHVATTYLFGMDPSVPSLGASGAISGVLGAYLILFPRRRVRVLMFSFYVQEVPAIVAIGIWFLFQVISGVGMLGGDSGGVAYGAHIGGFVAGMLLIRLFTLGRPAPPGPPPRMGVFA